MRAALDHAAWKVLTGQQLRGAARVGRLFVTRREEVGRPLPDVAGHVVEAVAVRRKGSDRRRALEAVELQVLPGKLPLPGVRPRLAVRKVLVAPGEDGAF